jgi:hypothetical protein
MVIKVHHRFEARFLVDHQHVGEQDSEGFVSDDLTRRPNRVPQAARLLLAHEGNASGTRRLPRHLVGQAMFVGVAQADVDFEGVVE